MGEQELGHTADGEAAEDAVLADVGGDLGHGAVLASLFG
jgi:hypothetical protein